MKQLSVGGVLDKNGGYFTPPLPADYTPVDPTKLQPDIPPAFAGTKDPNGDPNYEAEIKVSLYPTDLATLDAKPAPTSGPFKVNPGDKLDVVRMKKNGGFPVIVSLPSQLTPSSISVPTEYTVWYKEVDGNNCSCNGAIFPWGQGSSNYNIRVYAEEWGNSNGTNAESEVGDETNGHWYSTNSFNGYNLGYDTETADAFQEVAGSGGNPQFSSDTFNGFAVYEQTTLRTTVGFDNAWHDYFKSHGSCGNYNNTIGSLVYDGNYSPPVDNTITWAHYC